MYRWIERIPGVTRENDGLDTGIMGAAAARIAWVYTTIQFHMGCLRDPPMGAHSTCSSAPQKAARGGALE